MLKANHALSNSALIGKLTMAFLTGQSWHILKSWYTGGAQNKEFDAVSQIDLTRSYFHWWHRLP